MIKIYADGRERNSQILKKLSLIPNIDLVVVENMELADYVISHKRAFERKTPADYLSSLIGEEKGKVLRQCRDIAREYDVAELLIEGELSELFVRNIHPNSIWGSLQTITESGCGIKFTGNQDGTVAYLIQKAREEQEGKTGVFSPHGKKSHRTLPEQQEYIISSIVDVGGKTAQVLLSHFGSVEAVICADVAKLQEVKGIKKLAEKIRHVVGSEYR